MKLTVALITAAALLAACGKEAPPAAATPAPKPTKPAFAEAPRAPYTSIFEKPEAQEAVQAYQGALLALVQVLPQEPPSRRQDQALEPTEAERQAYAQLLQAEAGLKRALGKDAGALPRSISEVERKTLEDPSAYMVYRTNIGRLRAAGQSGVR